MQTRYNIATTYATFCDLRFFENGITLRSFYSKTIHMANNTIPEPDANDLRKIFDEQEDKGPYTKVPEGGGF
ncbi:MAG: hypothetical protein WC897_03875 [Candidatus Gracilibacteria bacterium]